MILKGMTVGPIQANCYILGCAKTRKGAVIDPGDETDRILKEIAAEQLELEYIINTHGHFDHCGGNFTLKHASGCRLAAHRLDVNMLENLSRTASAWGLHAKDSPPPDLLVEDGDTIQLGEIQLHVLHTPGHSPGSISLYTDAVAFTGDLIFSGSIGRTDFPGGDYDTLIESVRKKIFPLGDHVKILSGHGPVTTVGNERRTNPFFRG